MRGNQIVNRLWFVMIFLSAQLVAYYRLGAQESVGVERATADGKESCVKKGEAWKKTIRLEPSHRSGNFTEVVFLESGSGNDANVCYFNRDFGVVGDPIYVGVMTRHDSLSWNAVRLDPCSAQSAAPSVLLSSEKAGNTKTSKSAAASWDLETFLPRRCYNTAVDVTIVGQAGPKLLTQRYPLAQYDRYRATVQGGVLFTKLHDANFALRPDPSGGSSHFIYDKGPAKRGPEYAATINVYSVLRYFLPALGRDSGEVFRGRDPIHEQGLIDRVGAVLGAGVPEPSKRFVGGVSFELFYGISVIGVVDFTRVSRLADGTSTTANFTGAASDIPTKLIWLRERSVGLSMDLRYLSAFLTGKVQ